MDRSKFYSDHDTSGCVCFNIQDRNEYCVAIMKNMIKIPAESNYKKIFSFLAVVFVFVFDQDLLKNNLDVIFASK